MNTLTEVYDIQHWYMCMRQKHLMNGIKSALAIRVEGAGRRGDGVRRRRSWRSYKEMRQVFLSEFLSYYAGSTTIANSFFCHFRLPFCKNLVHINKQEENAEKTAAFTLFKRLKKQLPFFLFLPPEHTSSYIHLKTEKGFFLFVFFFRFPLFTYLFFFIFLYVYFVVLIYLVLSVLKWDILKWFRRIDWNIRKKQLSKQNGCIL